MFIYMYIYINTHMCVYIYIYIYIYSHIYVYIYVYIYLYICIYTYIYICIYLHICMYVNMYIYKSTCVHVHVHVHVPWYVPCGCACGCGCACACGCVRLIWQMRRVCERRDTIRDTGVWSVWHWCVMWHWCVRFDQTCLWATYLVVSVRISFICMTWLIVCVCDTLARS